MHDIILYDEVKTKWGLGHIKCGIKPCGSRYCPYIVRGTWTPCGRYHYVVFGYYTDDVNKRRKKFLGYNLIQAKNDMEHNLLFL